MTSQPCAYCRGTGIVPEITVTTETCCPVCNGTRLVDVIPWPRRPFTPVEKTKRAMPNATKTNAS